MRYDRNLHVCMTGNRYFLILIITYLFSLHLIHLCPVFLAFSIGHGVKKYERTFITLKMKENLSPY